MLHGIKIHENALKKKEKGNSVRAHFTCLLGSIALLY